MSVEKAALRERLGGAKPLVADGASGTMLMARGLKAGLCPEWFNLEKPEVLEEVAGAYLEAGADILHTNTFGATDLKLASHSLDSRFEAINEAAVQAVRGVAEGRVFVSASCGPTGRILKPYGDVEPEAVLASFERQIEVLSRAGVDAITVETMTDLREAELAIRAAKSVSPSTPVLATMTFERTQRGFFTIMGVSLEKAAAGLGAAGADAIGSNCGNGIENMVEIARELKELSSLPLVIQSNAGLPEIRDGAAVYLESPDFMAEKARALLEMGVAVIGGCCGTTPDHIRALRRLVDSL